MKVRFSWGTGMAVTYTAFVLATGAFVAFAMGRPVALVSDDYYAQSLRQDARMQAVANARALGPAVSVRNAGGRLLIVSLPASQARSARGTVVLYRASDPAADREGVGGQRSVGDGLAVNGPQPLREHVAAHYREGNPRLVLRLGHGPRGHGEQRDDQ